jgi:SAM-dependent methyltransferase
MTGDPRWIKFCRREEVSAINISRKEEMLMNWPERVWIYSPVRVIFQKREVAEWLRLVGRQQVNSALEIGCGLGRGARLLVEKMGFNRVVAFDLEYRLVRHAVRSLPSSLEDKIAYHVGNAEELPYEEASFDAVVNFGIIHHILDWRRCIAEIGRVTKAGGFFYFEEIYPPLYANFLLKRMLRHPTEDRFYAPEFLGALESNKFCLVDGVGMDSKYGIVGAARKM